MIQKKICMVGASGVGKTSLVQRFVKSVFSDQYLSTIGVKVDRKNVELVDGPVGLMLWDVEGQDDTTKLRTTYLRGAAGLIYVVDGTRRETFEALREIHAAILQEVGEVPTAIALNKMDMSDSWALQESDYKGLFENGKHPFATSAKTGEGVERLFRWMAGSLTGEVVAAPSDSEGLWDIAAVSSESVGVPTESHHLVATLQHSTTTLTTNLPPESDPANDGSALLVGVSEPQLGPVLGSGPSANHQSSSFFKALTTAISECFFTHGGGNEVELIESLENSAASVVGSLRTPLAGGQTEPNATLALLLGRRGFIVHTGATRLYWRREEGLYWVNESRAAVAAPCPSSEGGVAVAMPAQAPPTTMVSVVDLEPWEGLFLCNSSLMQAFSQEQVQATLSLPNTAQEICTAIVTASSQVATAQTPGSTGCVTLYARCYPSK